jgi:hypothetical protein
VHLDPQYASGVDGHDLDVDGGGLRVLGRVGRCLGHQVVGGDLDLLGRPQGDPHVQLDRDRGAAGSHCERRAQAAFGEDRRVDAAGQVSQLVQRTGQAGCQVVQLRGQPTDLGRHGRLRSTQLQDERDQPREWSCSMLVSELNAWDADRMPSRSSVPVVTVARRWGRAPGCLAPCSAVASPGGRRVG